MLEPSLKNVVVATDLSAGAAHALERATWLRFVPKGQLQLLYVVPGDVPAKVAAEATARVKKVLEPMAREAAGRIAKRGGAQVTGKVVVGRGEPFVEIIRHARASQADLIVLGRHGRRAIRDLVVGSTAERVLRKGDVPVLMVNEAARGPYLRPLAAVDFTDASYRVLELASALSSPQTPALQLVHAYHVPFEGALSRGMSKEVLAGFRKNSKDEAQARARKFLANVERAHPRFQVATREGDPRTVTLREAARLKADLVVIGTHGRDGLSHVLLGSVAEWLIRSCPSDLAVTRPAHFAFSLP